MMQDSRRSVFTQVFVLAFFLQIFFILADVQDSPGKAAEHFSVMYYQLDPAMQGCLCDELTQDEKNAMVEAYIRNAEKTASDLGYPLSYMKYCVYNVKTHTIRHPSGRMDVHLTGDMKKEFNPVFTHIARLFATGKTYPLDRTLPMVRENGKWKVCERFFPVSSG